MSRAHDGMIKMLSITAKTWKAHKGGDWCRWPGPGVYNCSPISQTDAYPKLDLETAITESDDADPLLITEFKKYQRVWESSGYRSRNHGVEVWQELTKRKVINPDEIHLALDVGCGNGRLVELWVDQGIDGEGVDWSSLSLDLALYQLYPERFHQQCLWDLKIPKLFDLGMCADVMEHVPEEKVDAVLQKIKKHCQKVVFKVANFEHVYHGQTLHLTLKGAEWWYEKIKAVGGSVARIVWAHGREEYVFLWHTEGYSL